MYRLSGIVVLLCVVIVYTFVFVYPTPLNETTRLRVVRRSLYHSNGLGQPVIVQRGRSNRPSLEEYNKLRNELVEAEESRILGSDIELNSDEEIANKVIMMAKDKEFDEGLTVPHLFNPSQHLFSVLKNISQSELFKILRRMPKGAVLHAHDTALCSTEYLVTLTYKADLWLCSDSDREAISFLFSKEKPPNKESCTWELTAKVREDRGAKNFDNYLMLRMSLYPKEKFEDNNAAWVSFMEIFRLIDGLLMYAPVWGEYFYQALKEFYEDGVLYLEFRTTLPVLYDLDGTAYTNIDTARLYEETLRSFKATNPEFIGAKLIYAPIRHVEGINVTEYIRTAVELKQRFPDFFAGFDLVGQEELGKPLIDFLPQILDVPDDINFYFHAGETNWYGSTVDENLIDAVLLGTKRIGHGFALIKHPAVLNLLKQHDIAVEVNPISNQVLQLVTDLRNHPCSHFFADSYPVVISSDDPSFWRATPLSHDFYVAFLGIASGHADLRLLKKLAINSIQYSAMTDDEKDVAMDKWSSKWDDYIQSLQNGATSMSNHID